MTEWLKFFFLSFFSNKISKGGATRSVGNFVLGLALSFCIVCCGLIAGYAAMFPRSYAAATEFKEFGHSAIAQDGLTLGFSDGKLTAELPGGAKFIDTIADKSTEKGEYALVIDPRDSSDIFVEFAIVCVGSGDEKITYEQYSALSADDKKKYTPTAEYSGACVDTLADLPKYVEFLDKVKTESDEHYNETISGEYTELQNKRLAEEISEEKFAAAAYSLYVRAYYPDLMLTDTNGLAPTLKRYYSDYSIRDGVDKYLIMFDDICFMTFYTSNGVKIDLTGEYTTLDGFVSSGEPADFDKIIDGVFRSSLALEFLVYVLSALRNAILYLAAILVIALIAYMAVKLAKSELFGTYIETLKVVGSFLLISSLVSFVATIIASLFLTRGAAFDFAGIVFVVVAFVRTAILVIPSIIADRKRRASGELYAADDGNGDTI